VQGQGFRDRSPEFAAEGAVILGASFDTVEENRAFAEAQNFGYRLLADTSKEVGEAYGVKKPPEEQWADFPRRITYLIDPDGIVRRTYQVTDVAANPEEVLADIRSLRGEQAGGT
jgi:thioredoxin-dependent peroxiredoxin